MNTSKVYLSLGSNMGDSYFYLLSALNNIDKLSNTRVSKVSKFYKTKPWGNEEQDDFINCACEIETGLLPYELLNAINIIERDLGRERLVHWGPRTIDIDIILYDDLTIESTRLTIPHKYYKERNFVLLPLFDIIDDISKVLPYIDRNSVDELEIYNYPRNILISSCLYGEDVRYDGGNNFSKLFVKLIKNNYVKVCPEEEGGLETPRDPAELIDERVITNKGCDVTKEFLEGAKKTKELAKKDGIEIAIMKAKSPSCGYKTIYDGSHSGVLVEGNGFTIRELLDLGIKIISV